MAVILREDFIEAVNFGNSDYLLLDAFMKDLLKKEIGEEFNRKKHKLMVQLRMNKKGQMFAAFWFVDKKEAKKI